MDNIAEIANSFSTIADGEFGLKNYVKRSGNDISVCFYAGGYAEFYNDGEITAVIDNDDRIMVWRLFPSVADMRSTLKRFRNYIYE